MKLKILDDEMNVQFSAGYVPCSDCLSGNCDNCFEVEQAYAENYPEVVFQLDTMFNRNTAHYRVKK